MKMYCVKCRAIKYILSPEFLILKNGKQAAKALCPDCHTAMFKLGGMAQQGEENRVNSDKQLLVNMLQSKL